MALKEKDILNFFRDFAEWAAKRKISALALVSGGCSLVLQTAFRKAAQDIDIQIRVTKIEGRDVRLSEFERINLLKEFCADSDNKYPIDIEYLEHLAIGGRFGFGSYRIPTVPCGSYMDNNGYGVAYYLTALQHEYMTKHIRISQRAFPKLKDLRDCIRLRVARSSKFRTPVNQSHLIV